MKTYNYIKNKNNEHGMSWHMDKMTVFSMIDQGTYMCSEPKNWSRYSVFRDQFVTVLIYYYFFLNQIE